MRFSRVRKYSKKVGEGVTGHKKKKLREKRYRRVPGGSPKYQNCEPQLFYIPRKNTVDFLREDSSINFDIISLTPINTMNFLQVQVHKAHAQEPDCHRLFEKSGEDDVAT